MKKIMTLISAGLFSFTLSSQTLRAVYANSPGTDDGFEAIEITGTPSAALTGITLIVIDGDATNAGTIDEAESLNSLSLGTNGLLLLRDAATSLTPGPNPATNVANLGSTLFNPDIENGTQTYLLVTGFTGAINDDIDSNNDGTANVSVPWASVLSAVSMIENDGASNYGYADDFGGTVLGPFAGFNPDIIAFETLLNQWVAGDVLGTNPGPYNIDPARNNVNATYDATVTLGSTASPLPVGMKNFRVVVKESNVLVMFSTATETNNSHFVIERSADARAFSEIGQVRGAGTTQEQHDYTFTDEKPLTGTNYYRLRQVDYDGAASFSPVVSVVFGKTDHITISPSPATDHVNIHLEEALNTTGRWQVFDNMGRQILSGAWEAESADYELDVNILPEGMYTFRLTVGAQVQVKQFRKM